jgi:hypothetical protein
VPLGIVIAEFHFRRDDRFRHGRVVKRRMAVAREDRADHVYASRLRRGLARKASIRFLGARSRQRRFPL